MPMSPRLLRPLASRSLVDADAAAYLTAVQNADNQALEPAVRNAITAFVIGCKADGIWSAIKSSCILMGARTLSGALTPLVGTAPTNNGPFVSGDYNRETGLVGNGTSKFLNTNRANNADPQDNRHACVYTSSLPSVTVRPLLGLNRSATDGASFIWDTITRFANSGSSNYVAQNGFIGLSRSASGSYVRRNAGGNSTITVSSTTPLSDNYVIFADSTGGGATPFYSDARIAFYSVGESMTLAQMDSRVTTLYNAIGAAIP